MKKCSIIVLLGLITAFGCGNPNSVQNEPKLEIPEKGVNPIPHIPGASYRFQESLNPAQKGKSASTVDWEKIEPILESAQRQTESKYVAVLSVQDSTGNWYAYNMQPLRFSEEIIDESKGKLRPYLFEVNTKEEEIPRIAVAYIPDSDKAMYKMDRWLQPNAFKKSKEETHSKNNDSCTFVHVDTVQVCRYSVTRGFVKEGTCEDVKVYDLWCPDGGGNDDPWDWPDDGEEGICLPPDSCGGGDDGSGTEETYCDPSALFPPPGCEEEDPDPCETGDPVLDDEAVQEGLDELWKDSNYGSDENPNPEFERKEQIGFIVSTTFGGYQFQRIHPSLITKQNACKVEFKKPDNLPPDAILVHSHPYKNGELQSECLTGFTYTYTNAPSEEDGAILEKVGLEKGVIIDAEKIIVFDKDENIIKEETRCGY